MLFRNHLIVTAAVTVVTIGYIDIPLPLWLVVMSILFGSLLPDLDHPSSTIGKRVLFISIPLSAIFGHRKITHSIWPILLTIWLVNFDNSTASALVLCLSIGYLSHLLGDIFTDSGIPFFWPLSFRFKSPIPVTTGGPFEYLIAYGLFICSLIF
ncbi:metal-dependent hydrolase (plasmid) [Shewanella sp. HL-SH4]|uniref:metal-dependent hydrolase n=1 Tax=Shewanella TaxID=22 RepID=UPI003D79D448